MKSWTQSGKSSERPFQNLKENDSSNPLIPAVIFYVIFFADHSNSQSFDKRITTQDALKKIETLIHEMVRARKEQEKTGFDKNTFAVYWPLKQEGIKKAKKNAPLINSVFMRFPNYKHNPDELRQLKAELYKLVLPLLGKDKMVSIVDELLKLKREK